MCLQIHDLYPRTVGDYVGLPFVNPCAVLHAKTGHLAPCHDGRANDTIHSHLRRVPFYMAIATQCQREGDAATTNRQSPVRKRRRQPGYLEGGRVKSARLSHQGNIPSLPSLAGWGCSSHSPLVPYPGGTCQTQDGGGDAIWETRKARNRSSPMTPSGQNAMRVTCRTRENANATDNVEGASLLFY